MASTCANYGVTVDDINNYAGPVTLSLSGAPPASTVTFTPVSATLPPSFSSALAVCTTAATPAGSYPLTITGTSGVITPSVTVQLNVTNFALTTAPASQNGTVNAPLTFAVTALEQNRFTGLISLSASNCPTNATCTFNPPSLRNGGSSTLTVTLADTTPPTSYNIGITAISGTLTQSNSVTVNVAPGLGLTTANTGVAARNTTVPITWVYTPSVGTSVNINLYRGNTLVQTIASGITIDSSTAGSFTYNWSVPGNLPIGSGYTIQLVDSSNYTVQSSNYLTIR
jgi:hypothetical protein